MKKYTNNNPSFSDSINMLEVTDTNHADNFNQAFKTLMDNCLSLKADKNKVQDESSGQEFKLGVENGLLYIEQIESEG